MTPAKRLPPGGEAVIKPERAQMTDEGQRETHVRTIEPRADECPDGIGPIGPHHIPLLRIL